MSDSEIPELAFRALVQANGLLRNKMDAYFAQHGISAAQWGVLRTLQRAKDAGLSGLRLHELGDRLLVKPPSVTTIIDRLERSGLVARQVSDEDQRAKQVSLTPRGHKLLHRVLKNHPAQIRSIMSGFSLAEQKQLYDLMNRFAEHLKDKNSISTTSVIATQSLQEKHAS